MASSLLMMGKRNSEIRVPDVHGLLISKVYSIPCLSGKNHTMTPVVRATRKMQIIMGINNWLPEFCESFMLIRIILRKYEKKLIPAIFCHFFVVCSAFSPMVATK